MKLTNTYDGYVETILVSGAERHPEGNNYVVIINYN